MITSLLALVPVGDAFGLSVSGAGDVNGDGFDDVDCFKAIAPIEKQNDFSSSDFLPFPIASCYHSVLDVAIVRPLCRLPLHRQGVNTWSWMLKQIS